MNHELAKMQKKEVIACVKVVCQYLPGGTDGKLDKISFSQLVSKTVIHNQDC
jgi:hypothetical protein